MSDVPNPTKHKQISFVKSGIRIIGAFCIGMEMPALGGLLFIVAELLGIAEEMV